MGTTVNKFLVALGASAAVMASVLADGKVSDGELSSVLISLVGAMLVWITPNKEA